MFREVSARPDYVRLEEQVLELWKATNAFERLREQTASGQPWSFMDGPITANNPMGVHHAWGRTYKDLYNRYHALLGKRLRWQQGFDSQGLWVEVEVEKQLGFRSKRDIESFGVDRFVEACKQRVYHFAAVQTEQSKRLGYWMDWENSYFTLSDQNNESIWHFLKVCHERSLIYRGSDVMPWCPRCATALSEMELNEGYQDVDHTAVYVLFPLPERPAEHLLVWTTTPWTLPANVAVAVHPELQYVRVELPQSAWLSSAAAARLGLTALEQRSGAELLGWVYTTAFAQLPLQQPLHHYVVAWDEVSADEGSGLVHLAPGAGQEDHALGRQLGLATLAPLDENGVFLDGYGPLSGTHALQATPQVQAWLSEQGLLWRAETYRHRYPHCWRCGTELLFRLVDEWFISMDPLREPLMQVARQANWLPAFGLERELDWLRNMGDWLISKKRYWGLALPIYPCAQCGKVTVVGSFQELRERAVSGWEEFEGHSPHRPWIDAVKLGCPNCAAPVSRVPDVGNPWLDAGIVPFSTLDYRHNREYWQHWFPADFVVESFPGQFRNWFYALLAMSTVLEGVTPFKHLLGYATVRDAHGAEMHKSKGNAIWFEEAVSWMGVEPLRWVFASQPVARNLLFSRELVEEALRSLQPLWEVYRFFVTYARAAQWKPDQGLGAEPPAETLNSLDRWLLARLNQLTGLCRSALDGYDVRQLTLAVEEFLDDLSNWYVRRSRRRFWGRSDGSNSDSAAFATLHYTLVTLARLLAPVLPFLSEALYQNLVCAIDAQAPLSVHLTGYPQARPALEHTLLDEMAALRQAVTLGRAARKQASLRVRQPLPRALLATDVPAQRLALEHFEAELLDELNVKQIEWVASADELLSYTIRPNLRLLGPRLGSRLAELRAVLEGLNPAEASSLAQQVAAEQQVTLHLADGTALELAPAELLVETQARAELVLASEQGLVLALDSQLTAELEREGRARDLVREVQEARRTAGLQVSDRIVLYLPEAQLADLGAEWAAYLAEETLALELRGATELRVQLAR